MTNDPQKTMLTWAMEETGFWADQQLKVDAVEQALVHWNETRPSVAVFRLENREVNLLTKPDGMLSASAVFAPRVAVYHKFLENLVNTRCRNVHTLLAIDMDDISTCDGPAPIMTFQKSGTSKAILIPDIDLLATNFLAPPELTDHIPYLAKRDSAIFVGSTTGLDPSGVPAQITQQTVRDGTLPRLRIAQFFKGHPDVKFELPSVVQCDTKETESLIRSLGLGAESRSWQEQFQHKFLISIDGNGATCLRVAAALRSNSALLKYDSPYRLYYFDHLRHGDQYLAISAESEIESIISRERAQPGVYAQVAEAGKRFFERFLTQDAVMSYSAALLEIYSDLLRRNGRGPGAKKLGSAATGFGGGYGGAVTRDTDTDWRHIADIEPFYGVLASEKFLLSNLDEHALADFYASGRADVEHAVTRLKALSPTGFKPQRAIDFGSGVGRLTLAMAKYADLVTGVDVAEGMRRAAESEAKTQGVVNVDFRSDLPDETVDWVHSLIVFQHIPPERGQAILRRLIQLVNVGGAISLQLTFFRDHRHVGEIVRDLANYRYDGHTVQLYDSHEAEAGVMSMYDYDLNRVFSDLFLAGFELLQVEHTDHAGCHGAYIFGVRTR